MRATGFTHIVFPNYTLTQVKVSFLLTDGVREVCFERVESVRMSTVTTEISTGTPSIERKRSF
jgi:hypothetical protein